MSRYADTHSQTRYDELQRTGGRPLNGPGWGMLIAARGGSFISERNPRNHTTITPGTTRVAPDYSLARERPELIKPADNRDARTYKAHP